MRLQTVIERYITFRRGLGAVFRGEAYLTRSFGKAMGVKTHIAEITEMQVRAFLAGKGQLTRAWHVKHSTLSVFFRYAVGRGYLKSSPMPTVVPKALPRFVPYIYSPEELRRLVKATSVYQRVANVMEPATALATLRLLYGTGLRISEAIALNRSDVDLREKVHRIRRTKFFKERLVPFGPQLAGSLAAYAARSTCSDDALQMESPFLTSRKGARLCQNTVQGAFERIRQQAQVVRSDGSKYQPRLHDLRHTFAVHCLTKWYRDGADVQKLLPLLSTYLGHRHLSGTMFYLSMTPGLLHEACKRFEKCFMEADHEEETI
jgi:integrase/recombinase XerD